MQVVGTEHPKVLLLSGAEVKAAALASSLGDQAEVRVVDSFQEAIEAIQSGQIDIVVSEAGDFLPGDCAQCDHWQRKSHEAATQGVAGVDLGGQIVWADAALQAMPEGARDAVVEASRRVADEWGEAGGAVDSRPHVTERLRIVGDARVGTDYEATLSPVLDANGKLTQVAVVIRDVTTSRKLQQRLQSVERAGQHLVRLDAEQFAGLDVPQRVAKIEEQIASYAHNLMNFERFSIRLLDRETGQLNVAMAQGMDDCVWHREMTASTEGQGICGYVATTGRSYICRDTSTDPHYLPGIDNAGSSLTVPLRLDEEVVGVFNVESSRVNAFDDVDRQMLRAFGRYVAMALKLLDLLVIERYRSAGELADDVSSEIAGPLNDIASDASALLSEYIGDDTLCARLEAISRNVGRIRECVKQVAQPAGRLRAGLNGHSRPDPLLVGKRLLVADDEDIIRDTLYEVLHKQGCHVDTARDGAQAISMLERTRYDLVLADIRMPYKSGYQVFSAAKERDSDCAVILITGFGYDPNHAIVRAREEGLSAVLFKPFKVDQLLDEVRQALGQSVVG